MNRIISFHELRKRYHALRMVGAFFTLLGFLLLATGTLVLAYGLNLLLTAGTGESAPEAGPFAIRQTGGLFAGVDMRVILSLLYSFCFLLAGLAAHCDGALCRLFIHLEENTSRDSAISGQDSREVGVEC